MAKSDILSPRFMRLAGAITYSGLNRTRLYRLIADGAVIARKAGKATLIERESLDRHLDGLPNAEIRLPGSASKQAA